MRKFLGLMFLVAALLAVAPAAGAQPETARDPFAPLIAPPTVAPTGVPGAPAAPAPTIAPTAPAVDPLPDTGASTGSWAGIGYVLVAFGAGAVVLSKVFGPTPVSTR